MKDKNMHIIIRMLIHSSFRVLISCCPHADQSLPKLPAPHERLKQVYSRQMSELCRQIYHYIWTSFIGHTLWHLSDISRSHFSSRSLLLYVIKNKKIITVSFSINFVFSVHKKKGKISLFVFVSLKPVFEKWIMSYAPSCSGHAVALLVEALRYKPERRGFDSRWCHWN